VAPEDLKSPSDTVGSPPHGLPVKPEITNLGAAFSANQEATPTPLTPGWLLWTIACNFSVAAGSCSSTILRLRTKKWTFEHFCKRKRKKTIIYLVVCYLEIQLRNFHNKQAH